MSDDTVTPVSPESVPTAGGRSGQLEAQRLVGLFALGWLLFGYPLMGLWDQPLPRPGLPLFPLAIFACWAVLIAVLACLMERGDRAAGSGSDGGA